MKKSDFDTSGLSTTSESSSNLTIDKNKKDSFRSSVFAEKDDFLTSLLNTQSPETPAPSLTNPKEVNETKIEVGHFGEAKKITLGNWKNVENVSCRLIDKYDDVVVLECLIDKDAGIFEEREFRKSLFENYDLTIGNLFYLRFFDRANETRMEVHNDPNLISLGDFPKMDFKTLIASSKLFK
jgi:hypothetical protein